MLLVSGEFDPATPPQFGKAAAESLPNSRQVVVPNIAHNYDSDCIRRVTAEFILKGSATELDIGCIERLRPPEFAKELPAHF